MCVCVRASAHVCALHKNPMADSQRSQTTEEQQPRKQCVSQRTIRVVYRARHPDPPDVATLNLNSDSEEDTPILPSNQLELEQPGTSGSGAVDTDRPHGISYYPPPPPPTPKEEEEEEEEQQEEHKWSFLTQFIGAPSERRGGRDNSNSIDEETDKLKTQYLDYTETLDRARDHMASLLRAESKGKTPQGMTIGVKASMVDKDNPSFKSAWNLAIERAEKSLMTTLKSHLSNVMEKSKKSIRLSAKKSIQK